MREPMIETCSTETETEALPVAPATSTKRARKYLLTSGIAKCGLCGEEMEGKPTKDTVPGYACVQSSAHHPERKGCGAVYINSLSLDEYVAGKVLAVLAMPKSVSLLQALVTRSMQTGSALTDEIAVAQAEYRLKVAERKLFQPGMSAEAAKIHDHPYQQKIRDLRRQVRRAKVELDALGPLRTPEQLAYWWENDATVLERHDLVRVCVQEIKIYPTARRGYRGFQEERIEIIWQPGISWKKLSH